MWNLVLGGVLEASWSDLGRVFGGQDAPKTAQDGAKTAQDGAKTAQDGAKAAQDGTKTAPRRLQKLVQDGFKTDQDSPSENKKTWNMLCRTHHGPRRPKTAPSKPQDGTKTGPSSPREHQEKHFAFGFVSISGSRKR